ncbi:MAG: glycosyltransferase [Acidobacteria bacterium]|nr:glycosyltransferase [Acidobacteriota bacterium]
MAAEPIRLLNVVPTLMCGGTENQFMALTRSVDPSRIVPEFACLRRWGGFVSEIDDRGIPLREYGISTFLSLHAVGQQAKLARHIRQRRFDIVHSYNFYGNVFAIPPARLAGAPVVIASIRDRGAYLTPLQQRVQRQVCRFADCILVNADAVKDWLVDQGYDPKTIAVIRNGVELHRFKQPPDVERLRRELGVPAGARLVAVVSRLNRLKGVEHFLEAAADVGQRFPDARFLVVGETNPSDRPYMKVLTDLVERLHIGDRVVFTGLRADVPELLAAATISVMPSLNEALSNVLLESMAAGAPVVATRVGGTPEAIEDGVNGLLVPPGDSGALARAIDRLLADPGLAARYGQAGRERIAQRFSMDRMVNATEQLYRSLLDKRRPIAVGRSTEFACK